MVSLPIIWVQCAGAFVSWCLSLFVLFNAAFDFRVLRRARLNGVREILTTGAIVSALGSVALNSFMLLTFVLLVVRGQPYPFSYIAWLFFMVTLVLAISSVNDYVTRRRAMQALEDYMRKEQTYE